VYDQRIRILRSLFLPLVSPADEADRADALVPLCRDRPLATTMGARAEALVAERFTWRTQAAQLATYYDDLVGVQPCRN
jgi:glycosyltransferase involved in cell wall biosynthesis